MSCSSMVGGHRKRLASTGRRSQTTVWFRLLCASKGRIRLREFPPDSLEELLENHGRFERDPR
jgi:hypothetical protein